MENRVPIDGRVESCVIPERSFISQFAGLNIPLQDKIDIGRYFNVARLTLYKLDRFFSNESSEKHFIEPIRQRRGRSKSVSGISTETDCDRHSLFFFVVPPAVARADFVNLPMHAGRPIVKDLHSVHSKIALSCVRISGVDNRQRNKSSAVSGPTEENR